MNIVRKSMMALLGIIALMTSISEAKFYVPQFKDDFYTYIDRHKLAVVHFTTVAEDEHNKELDEMKEAFLSLSKRDRYKKAGADLAFIGVNLNTIPALAEDFDISPEEKSVVILFKDGKEFKKARKTGFLTRTALKDLIETNFGSFIDSIINKKDQEERERDGHRIQTTYPQTERVVTRRVYTEYPSYYYYRRPRVSFGIGYGRPWGWGGWGGGGWGHRWGGGFGLGFGW